MIKINKKYSDESLKRKKVLLFISDNFDGFSSYIVARNYFGQVDFIMNDIEEKVSFDEKLQKVSYSEQLDKYDFIIICGQPISLEMAKEFNRYCREDGATLFIIDNSEVAIAKKLNDLDFANVKVTNNSHNLTCITELLNNLIRQLGGSRNSTLEEYVELVRLYQSSIYAQQDEITLTEDIIREYDKYILEMKKDKLQLAEKIEMLYEIMPMDEFFEHISKKLESKHISLTKEEKKLMLKEI